MAKKMGKTETVPIPAGYTKFDVAEYLDSPAVIAEYLSIAAVENDTGALVQALGSVARAQGMAEIARKANVSRESLYKSIAPGATPRIDTVQKLMSAMGVHMTIVPDAQQKKPKKATKRAAQRA